MLILIVLALSCHIPFSSLDVRCVPLLGFVRSSVRLLPFFPQAVWRGVDVAVKSLESKEVRKKEHKLGTLSTTDNTPIEGWMVAALNLSSRKTRCGS